MNFWKTLLASLLGSFLAFGLVMLIFVLLMLAAIGGAINSASGGGQPIAVKDNSVLYLELENSVVERANDNEMMFNPASLEGETNMGLNRFVEALQRASTDDKIKGAFVELKSFNAGPASLREMHRALKDFKASGKWIVAYGENYDQAGYYLASVADEVTMHPEGMFDWRGLHTELMFFKNMFERIGVDVQVIRGPDNKYKSAVEPFMYDKMSDANREQMKALVDDLWQHMLTDISESRGVSVPDLMMMADSLSLVDQQMAVDKGVLTGLNYRDEVIGGIVNRLTGADSLTDVSEENLNLIAFSDYCRAPKIRREGETADHRKDKVAVVYAVGAIESGEGDDMTIGSDRIAKALREAREDKNVKAIVLRVNSPGGSALASDVIWHETKLIKESGKPFVVSMGDYAASGGYYISCAADSIFANSS
ncbi:MAG: signal peptide peptidase SppA, partial [Flavobacteriales bacterium]|nr:signal peptide peptidase SppA [Flavobacteriales bacterium]